MPHELDKTALEADPAESPRRAASSTPQDPGTAPADTPVSPEVEPPLGPDTDTALVPTDSLSRYMAEIRRYPLLSPEEEHTLAVRYKEYGDVQAAYRLVTANLRLVVMIARNYQRAFRNLLDLIQEGNVGLMEAVRNFDPYRGVRFPLLCRVVGAGVYHPVRHEQLADGQNRHHPGPAQALLQPGTGKKAARSRGFLARSQTAGPESGRQGRGSESRCSNGCLPEICLSIPRSMPTTSPRACSTFLADPQATVEEEVSATEYRALVREKMDAFAQTLSGKDAVIFHQRLLAEEPRTPAGNRRSVRHQPRTGPPVGESAEKKAQSLSRPGVHRSAETWMSLSPISAESAPASLGPDPGSHSILLSGLK